MTQYMNYAKDYGKLMDINQLLYFEKHEATNQYSTMVNNYGQVFYCESDEDNQETGEWKPIFLDLQAMSVLH